MPAFLISLIVWAPYLLVAIICGVIFGILGYKRGSAKAGISIGVTIVSSLLSLLFSKLISRLLAGSVSGTLANLCERYIPDSIPIPFGDILTASTSFAGAIFALILYLPIFFILALVLKLVVSAIFKKRIPKPESVGNRLGGLGISLADAAIYAVLLFIPIYGTLSLIGNVVDVAEAVPEGELGGVPYEVVEYASAATNVLPGDIPPFTMIYDSLFTFEVDGTKVCLPETVRTTSDLLCDVAAIGFDSDNVSDELLVSALDKAETFIVKNEFITDFVCKYGVDVIPDIKLGALGKISIKEYYPSLSDGELLRNDIPAFFDLFKTVVNNGMIKALNGKGFDMSKVNAEALSRDLGGVFNHSVGISTLKSKVVKGVVDILSDELINEGKNEDGSVTELINAIAAIPETPYTGEDAVKEGESLYLIMSGVLTMGDTDHMGKALGLIIEGLARHPAVDTDKVINVAESLLSTSGMDGTSVLADSIKDKLNESISKPVGESTFPAFCDTAFATATALGNIASGKDGAESLESLITADPESLNSVKEVLSDELLKEIGMGENSEKVTDVIDAVFNTIIESSLSEQEAKKEAEALNELLNVVNDINSGNSNAVVNRADELIGLCTESVVISGTLESLTEGGASDPTGLFASLDSESKAQISDKIDSYVAENGANETLNALKLFMGIN